MNSMHASFAIGTFISPFLSKPFLSEKVYSNTPNETIPEHKQSNNDTSRVTLLYPLIALALFLWSLGYVVMGIKDLREQKKENENPVGLKSSQSRTPKASLSNLKIFLIGVVCLIMIMELGVESSNFTYMQAFIVKSKYQLTKAQGADILGLYVGCYALARISCSFLAIKVKASYILILNGIILSTGTIFLIYAGDNFLTLTLIGYGMTGFALGATFANIVVWVKGFTEVDSKAMTSFIVACGIGTNIAPLVTGQIISNEPLISLYLQAVAVLLAFVLFGVAFWLGSKVFEMERESGGSNKEEGAIEMS